MPATSKNHPLRRAPEPASPTLQHASARHEFPSAWWTVLHATQSDAKRAPVSLNEEQFLDIEVAPREDQQAVRENVISFDSSPDLVIETSQLTEL